MERFGSQSGAGTVGGQRRAVPLLYGLVMLAVFVVTVTVIAVKAGSSSAIVTAVVTVAVAGTAFGLWGASMAVRETGGEAPPPASREDHGWLRAVGTSRGESD